MQRYRDIDIDIDIDTHSIHLLRTRQETHTKLVHKFFTPKQELVVL